MPKSPVLEAVEALRAKGYRVSPTQGTPNLWEVDGQQHALSDRGVILLARHVVAYTLVRLTQ